MTPPYQASHCPDVCHQEVARLQAPFFLCVSYLELYSSLKPSHNQRKLLWIAIERISDMPREEDSGTIYTFTPRTTAVLR